MSDETNVEAKRPRLDTSIAPDNTRWQIEAVLSDEFRQPTKRCDVIVCEIVDRKSTSQILIQLCQLIPLHRLNHLKRVFNSRIILCTVSAIEEFISNIEESPSMQSIAAQLSQSSQRPYSQETIDIICTDILPPFLQNHNVPNESIELLCKNVDIVSVAAAVPMLQWQYKDVMLSWPSKFHPNKKLEHLCSGEMFSRDEYGFHSIMMDICYFLKNEFKRNACGIAIDPRTRSIVAIGFDELDRHPLMHCAMVLIDSVARTQYGGAWNQYLIDKPETIYSNIVNKADEQAIVGVSPFIRELISAKFPMMQHFDSEPPQTYDGESNRLLELQNGNTDIDNLGKYGPYLCTGYDIYLTQESCIMCSMALTHSRIRNIFFAEERPNGAICSLVKLHCVKALNHHFQVFHMKSMASGS